MQYDSKTFGFGFGLSTGIGLFILLAISLLLFGCPKYNVWQQGLAGEAELARATANRKIRVQEAEAKKESAKLEGDAEAARAAGLAKANAIIGESLGGDHGEKYLRYLWITGMEKSQHDTIYVPTEAGLPILEATRKLKIQAQPEAK